MKRTITLASALLVSTMLAAGAAGAKTLVYCSEGSPENFTPALNTTGTSLDAARPSSTSSSNSSAARPMWSRRWPKNMKFRRTV